jgi:hypothetical protein
MVLGLMLYAVTAVSLPTGMTADFGRTTQPQVAIDAPPAALALSQRGSLAVIIVKANPGDGPNTPMLLVVRSDGTRAVVKSPSDAVLSKAFGVYAEGPAGEHTFPGSQFSGVALANDGTPFATVEYRFSGAYSGTEEAIYRWSGERWRNVLPKSAALADTANITIAAAESPSKYACNIDYAGTFSSVDEAEHDPHYQMNQALLVEGNRGFSLGYGAVTASRGRFLVGYTAGVRSVMMNWGQPVQAAAALEWIDGRRTILGPGVAYGVNDMGDAVGDTNPPSGVAQAPTLWRHDRAMRLTDATGTAYAIADDGTIVGKIGNNAFLVRGADSSLKVLRIDELLRDRSWHITAAYAIAKNGRILATGRRNDGRMRVLLLDPVATPARTKLRAPRYTM